MTVSLRSAREPFDVARDRREYYRWLETERSAEFGSTFTHQETGQVESYAHFAPTAVEAQQQLELDLPNCSLRHAIRRALAGALEERVLPLCNSKWVHQYIERLRAARWSGAVAYSVSKGKLIVYWDQKAGLSRLCPDDAREEAMRLQRRVLDPLEALQADGHALHYCVLTTRNAAPGELRAEMVRIGRRLRKLLKAFPEIKGALSVLEAPLGSARDWNVHLNVIFVVKGYFDYEKLRRWWHWNLDVRKLPHGPGVVRGALCELIKYAVAATVAKSAEKAAEGGGGAAGTREPPPPMLDWTGQELLEWLRAMRGYRRTRTYGCLFRLKKPKAEDPGQLLWLGRIDHDGVRYKASLSLLDSIPEDKSLGTSPRNRLEALFRQLAPGGLQGAGTLGDSIPRDALHRSLEALLKM